MITEQNSSSKKNLVIILSVLILLLVLAVIVILFPLKELFFNEQEAPTIELVVMDSLTPVFTAGKYRIVVEALVTGNPEPDVIFNRDDSLGQMEDNITLILLEENETFTLTAVALNKKGQDSATIELVARIEADNNSEPGFERDQVLDSSPDPVPDNGSSQEPGQIPKPEPEPDPVPEPDQLPDQAPEIEPDNEELVILPKPELPNATEGNLIEFLPAEKQVEIPNLLKVKTLGPLQNLLNERGSVVERVDHTPIYAGADVCAAGDNYWNHTFRGFMSFDISSIPRSSTIIEATLDLSGYVLMGDPFSALGRLSIFGTPYYWPGIQTAILDADQDRLANLYLSGTGRWNLGEYSSIPSPWYIDVTDWMEANLASHRSRCQFKFQFSRKTNNDDSLDLMYLNNATLTVKYREN